MKEIPLSGKRGKGLVALVDDEDWPWLMEYCWHVNGKLYVYHGFKIHGRMRKASIHRVIMNAPNGIDVDHRDGNHLNNQKYNLRLASVMQNSANQRIRTFPKSSRFKGVCFCKRHIERGWSKPWVALIKLNYKSRYLGNFSTEIEAALAYNQAAVRLFGEFACLNEI